MKKGREGKQNKRNGGNFFKYLQPPPSQLLQQHSKLHSRSLIDLQQNSSRYQQSARMPSGRDAHHSSLCANDPLEVDTIKSNSLKKFLSIFGGPANLSQHPRNSGREQKPSSKGSARQVFTCNIKNMNVNVSSSKDREPKQGNTLLVLKRQKAQSKSVISHCSVAHDNQQQNAMAELKRTLEESRQRETMLKKQIEQYQRQNQLLKNQKESMLAQSKMLESMFGEREREFTNKIEHLQKVKLKEKCRQHDLVIESLKKVINEQLRKIIELEKCKIEREEIQRLEERINKNITIANETTLKQKLRMIEQGSQAIGIKRKEARMIKIEEECFESAATSPNRELQTYEDIIQEATEQQQRGSQSKVLQPDQDSILQEVDKYLSKWRLKS